MKKDGHKLFHAIKSYPTLEKQDREGVHIWLGMTWSFLFAILKFIIGCVTGSGYLCVSALYSALLGAAKYKLIHFRYDDSQRQKTENEVFGELGLVVMLAGIVYGTYMGRLIPFPRIFHYEIWQGLLISIVCFLDIGISVYHLMHTSGGTNHSILRLGQRISSLVAALPAAAMAQIALGACLNPNDMSIWNGIFGIAVGNVQMIVGASMMRYAWVHRHT